MVEFVSYDGGFPNLCRGILTVKIDGKEVKFGHNYENYNSETNTFSDEDKNNPNYEPFWSSGGKIVMDKRGNFSMKRGEWVASFNPESFPSAVVDLAPELLRVFNENVPCGCCGGCI